MIDFSALLHQNPRLWIYLCIAGSVMLIVEAVGLVISRQRSLRSNVNRRLTLLNESSDREATLVQLRRDRGLTDEGRYALPLISFNRLLLQSGVGLGGGRMLAVMALSGATAGMISFMLTRHYLLALILTMLAGLVLPGLFLLFKRGRRHGKFAEQLPEALDLLVRSLRAGHPIVVAVSMVAREMPDPIGSEFGMTADEMTYGLDLETALQNMRARVGQQDLSFVVVAVSVQSKTGGNLSEILSNLARVIRDRFKLRRRVKAMSAEGRMSAIALSLIPLGVFLIVNALSPKFYGEIKGDPIILPVAVITAVVWAAGVAIIHRLVNFKY